MVFLSNGRIFLDAIGLPTMKPRSTQCAVRYGMRKPDPKPALRVGLIITANRCKLNRKMNRTVH
jgi:hypothetical protein